MVDTLEKIHSQGIVYRDVKPENICVGIRNPNKIFLVDFGLAKHFMKKVTDEKERTKMVHIPLSDGHSLIGTPRYASVNSHMGLEQSRRDDLESLVYVIVYLLNGSLPWCGLDYETRQEKYVKIKYTKE